MGDEQEIPRWGRKWDGAETSQAEGVEGRKDISRKWLSGHCKYTVSSSSVQCVRRSGRRWEENREQRESTAGEAGEGAPLLTSVELSPEKRDVFWFLLFYCLCFCFVLTISLKYVSTVFFF